MGTGPYWYIQYDGDGSIRLEANPLWWKHAPGLGSILMKRYREAGQAIEAIQTNQIQMLTTRSPKASFSRKLADLTSLDYTTLTYECLLPNLSSGSLLSELNVRQAVMYAVDRVTVASNAYVDMAVPCEVPVPPGSWLYETQSAIYYYSPERALQLMNNLGWYDMTGNGTLNQLEGIMLKEPDVNIVTYNEGTNSIRENAANLIAGYLNDVGFNATVTVLSKDKARDRIRGRDYDLALVGFNLSEVPLLDDLLGSGGSLNLNHYSNEAMDALLGRVSNASDPDELQRIYSEIQLTNLAHEHWTNLQSALAGKIDGLMNIDLGFLGMNLGETPAISTLWNGPYTWAAIGLFLIPIVSAAASWLGMKVAAAANPQNDANPQAQATAKSMNLMMPVMSLWIGYSMPAAMAIYWIANSVFTTVRDLIITRIVKKQIAEEDAVREASRSERERELEEKRLETERLRAEGKTEQNANTSKKKLQAGEKQKSEERKAALERAERAARRERLGVPETEKPASQVGNRRYARGRAYVEDRFDNPEQAEEATLLAAEASENAPAIDETVEAVEIDELVETVETVETEGEV